MIELMVVIVILGILVTLVAATYGGVQAKNRNGQREVAIDTLKGDLESYYAQSNMYPTVTELNDSSWVSKNIPDLTVSTLQDPSWSDKVTACTVDHHSVVIDTAAVDCYTYQPVTTDGSACDNIQKICAHYTLTASLEGGLQYVKSSLN